MEAKDIEDSWFTDVFALHFCSVSLGDFPMKEAHKRRLTADCEAEPLSVLIPIFGWLSGRIRKLCEM